jgi:hypothetical protein
VTKLNTEENDIDWNQVLEDMREDTEANQSNISPPVRQWILDGDVQVGSGVGVVFHPDIEQKRIEDLVNEIISVHPPKGCRRDLIIIDDQIYQEIWKGERGHYFIRMSLRDNPDATWVAERHTARFTVKSGKVMATELLAGIRDSTLHRIKQEFREKGGGKILFKSSKAAFNRQWLEKVLERAKLPTEAINSILIGLERNLAPARRELTRILSRQGYSSFIIKWLMEDVSEIIDSE